MIDRRFESFGVRVGRAAVSLLSAVVALYLLVAAGHAYGDPSSELQRYRRDQPLPHVFVKGTVLRRTNEELKPLCEVRHERYQKCGKNYCWSRIESFTYSNAKVDVAWSSSPVPKTLNLDWNFSEEPWRFPTEIITVTGLAQRWQAFAQKNHLGFDENGFYGSRDRIVQNCVDEGEPVYVEACLSSKSPDSLEPCAGERTYGVVYDGDDQVARDDGADGVALRLGGAMIALLVAMLAWIRPALPIVGGLEDRAAPHERRLGAAVWALLAVPPLAGIVAFMMRASHPPSTWASGRVGFALAISAMAGWLFLMATRLHYRRRVRYALGPVLDTPRSLLANANGTVELHVKAKVRDGGVKALIGDDTVAYSEIKITERYQAGKNVGKRTVVEMRQRNDVTIVDESGEGTLDLQRALLDVELRRTVMKELSPTYAERGIVAGQVQSHIDYIIDERVIKDGERLYVFGDVSGISVQSGGSAFRDGGYRMVRGSPTLGGRDAAPVLVYAGIEQGLINKLTAEARTANTFAVIAVCICGAMALSLVALAMQ